MLIDSQYPSRTLALKPIRRTLDPAGRDQIIAATVFHVFFKGYYLHSLFERDNLPMLVEGSIAVRQAQYLAKQSVEIGLELYWTHSLIP
jgi:hypothetical protein